uniref:glycerol-3-phosphate dehydrogenase n=1 Tax=Lates calcarifer TaxID=8187 RepID=A0A4W6FP16_LATCA
MRESLKTAPVQGDNFSSGTSSRSTKLIHGGVRYLQKAIMKLDYKQVNASFFLPISLMQSDRDRCDISVPTHFHTTSHRLGVTHIPLLWSCPPAAGQHNDARMNLAIALTAARYGAAIANYTEVVHLLKRADPQTGKERVCGAHCRDVITGQEFDVRAKCVINATGPFTDALRKMDDQKNPRHLSAQCRGAHRHPGLLQVTNGGPLCLCHCITYSLVLPSHQFISQHQQRLFSLWPQTLGSVW